MYKDIIVNINNIDHNLTALHNAADNNTSNNVTTDPDPALKHDARENDEEENEDPLNEYRAPVSETCLESVIPYYPVTADDSAQSTGNEVYSIAPGENKHPLSFMCDKRCVKLAFPVLFPKGRYGYTAKRQVQFHQ